MGNVFTSYIILDDSISIDSTDPFIFSHIYCGYVELNSTTYQPVIPRSKFDTLTSFPTTIKNINPAIKLLLSIGNIDGSDVETFSRMVIFPSRRRTFINSCIELAKRYNYDGFEIHWLHPSTATEMTNFGHLVKEWREAIRSDFTLVARVHYSPYPSPNLIYPYIDMESSLDWIDISPHDFYTPESSPLRTGPSQAFFNPTDKPLSREFGLEQWIKVFPHEKIVYSYPTHGWAWKLKNSKENGIFAAAEGPSTDISPNGFIENAVFIYTERPSEVYSEEFMVNYFHSENTWITYESNFIEKYNFVLEKYGTLGTCVFYQRSNTNYPRALIDEGKAKWKKLREEKKVLK